MLSGAGCGSAVRREQAIHQRLQAVGLLHDHLRVLVQLRPLELALEQLRGAADAAERILDLVREVADQLAVGLALLEHALLARDLQLLLDVAELEQQALPAGDPASSSTGVTVQDKCSRA